MSFLYMHFKGKTSSPWHIGLRKYSDYLYTRTDYLWGRGIRGPVLRQLWRTYCPKSDAHEGVNFYPEVDCSKCIAGPECPFGNLRGTDDEGEFKDKPRLIITSLFFDRETVRKDRVALSTLSDQHLSVVEEKAPIFVEYISEGAEFEFEAILMGEGVRFSEQFTSAVKVSLRFLGWGGYCNEGFGRGTILNIREFGFNNFEDNVINPVAHDIMAKANDLGYLTFGISPMLILDKDGGGKEIYSNIFEDGFKQKLCDCINERFWQFYNNHLYIQSSIESIGGKTRTETVQAWSRKIGSRMAFKGIGNEITVQFSGKLDAEKAKALAIAKYGVGRYKNQGFGSLRLHPKSV